MAKNISISLDDHFISYQVMTERFSLATEVVKAALRLFEQKEKYKTVLAQELTKGEESGFIAKTDRKNFINGLHEKYVK